MTILRIPAASSIRTRTHRWCVDTNSKTCCLYQSCVLTDAVESICGNTHVQAGLVQPL